MEKIIDKLLDMINLQSKTGLQAYTVIIIIVFSLLYCQIFIISLDYFQGFPQWLWYSTVYIIFFLIQLSIFSSDTLYYGEPAKSRYVKIFQEHWPSRHIAKKFKLDLETASYYWLCIFNKWEQTGHPMHSQWQRTFERGYKCRLIFSCIKFFEFLLVLTSVSLWIGLICKFLLEQPISLSYSQSVFGFMIVIFYVLIRIINITSITKPSGVWRQYAEINKLHIAWIEQNVASQKKLEELSR